MSQNNLTKLPIWAQQHIQQLELKLHDDLGLAHDRITELEDIIIDLVDGAMITWYDIMAQTGLPESESRALADKISAIYRKRFSNNNG